MNMFVISVKGINFKFHLEKKRKKKNYFFLLTCSGVIETLDYAKESKQKQKT